MPDRPEMVEALPVRRTGQWLVGVAALAVALFLVYSFAVSPNIQWTEVIAYFLDGRILSGLWLTILLTVLCMVIGVGGGILLAIMKLSGNPVLNFLSATFLLLFRGTPVLVQIIIWFNLSLVFPYIAGIPTNTLITPFAAALLGLGLNEAAYMAEIVRAGIESVDDGQSEATAASGLTKGQALRFVILPQAMRAIIPPTGNQFIGMLKATSLVSVIATQELLTQAQHIYSQNFLTIELLIVTCIWYLLMTTVATIIQSSIETKLSAGDRNVRAPGIGQLVVRALSFRRPVEGIDWRNAP